MEINNATLIEEYCKSMKRQRLSADVQHQYPQLIRNFSDFIGSDRDLLTVGKHDLEAYIDYLQDERGVMEGTTKKILTAISSFYRFLEYEDRITRNLVPAVRENYFGKGGKPQSNGQFRQCITVEEAGKLVLNVLDPRDKCIIVLLMKTGMRLHELAELNLSDLDIPENTIYLHPTGKRSNRVVFFDNDCVYVLKKWLIRREKENVKGIDALFIDRYGKRLSPTAIRRLLKKYAVVVGLHDPKSDRHDLRHRLTPHCLRHSFTTWLGEAEEDEKGEIKKAAMDLPVVQWLRGDSGGAAVYRYLHLTPKKIRDMYLTKMPPLGIV